jgi:hypothetical protein
MSDRNKIQRALEIVSDVRGQGVAFDDKENTLHACGKVYHFDDTDTLIFIEEK